MAHSSGSIKHIYVVRDSVFCVCFSSIYELGFEYIIWMEFQTKMSKRYPCHYSSTALMSVMGSVQSVAFALCVERDWSQWKLGWNIKLFTAAYSVKSLLIN